MVRSRSEALAAAMAAKTNAVGTCQYVTRNWFDAPSVGDVDGDKDADAVDGWLSEPPEKRHTDRNPPVGVPVAFGGGRRGFGHRAITRAPGGNLRSTDMYDGHYRAGTVGNATIAEIEAAMGVHYLGWSETIDGLPIPPGGGTMATTFGADLSHFQFDNGFKLELLKPQGYMFVILKCTQGTGWIDTTYPAARAKAESLGYLTAVYHFLEHGDADKQAANLAAHIIDKTLPVFIDFEPVPNRPKPTLKDWVDFRNSCTKRGLRVVGKYATSTYLSEMGIKTIVGPLVWWRAAYPTMDVKYGSQLYPGNSHSRWDSYGGQTPTLWQFASSAKVDGYNGTIDVNAFRGTVADLKKLNLFKDYSVKTSPPPPPKPTPPTKHKDFRVFLVPGNKVETVDAVKYDMGLVKAISTGGSAVVFNTERESPELRQAVKDGLGSGYTTVFDNEGIIGYGSNWSPNGDPYALLLAKDDPGMAGVSPNRFLDMIPLENKYLSDAMIKFKDCHLVSEAHCIHKNVYGRAWREKTWKIQIDDVLDAVEYDYKNGNSTVLAGDFNTGVYFDGHDLFALMQKRFGKDVVHVHNGNLDHIFLISGPHVRLSEIGLDFVTNNKSDHDMITAMIRATV